MHLPRLVTTALLNIALANVVSGYYSSGWSPDGTDDAAQPVPEPSLTGEAPAATATGFSFDWTALLTQGPIGEAFKLAGINVTERLEAAKKKAEQVPFDTRIPLITDENYESLVKEDADKEDTWFIVVTLANSQDPVSKLFDDTFDQAYDLSLASQDLHHVKWGRVDYMAVTRVTTEWMVWKAPVLVIARKAGTELRFLYPSQVSLDAPKIHKFLKNKEWVEVPVWDSAFAPGGKYEPVIKSFAKFTESSYGIFSRIPKWLFLILSGSMASFIISLMHGSSKPSETTAAADAKSNGKATTIEGDGSPAEKKPRTKRFVVKKANEVHPELATSMTASMISESGMTSSMVSESEGLASDGAGGKRPGGGARRRSTRTKAKK